MKMTLSRLPFAMLLAASAAACAADTTDKADTAGSEDDLTSLTARSRELQFAGYVYVDPSADDASIVREIKKQTQSAFGALRDASIGVNSRELKDVDPATFLKVPVEVVDPANPTAKQSLLKVSYTFTDQAVVPVTMATRTALPLGLLGKNYQSQSQRIFTECTSGDAHAKEFIGSIWYVFDPSRASCKKAMTAEQTQIDTDRAGLAEGQIPKSELNRLYIPMTVNLRPTVAMGQNKYPEYDRLYAGGVEPGKLVIGMVSGMMADWAAGEKHEIYDDAGYDMWYGGLREIFRARPGFKLVTVEGVTDPLTYKLADKDVHFASFDDLVAFELDRKNPQGVTTYQERNDLRKVIATTLVRHWVVLEAPVTATIAGESKPLTIKLQTYFGAETNSAPHKRGIKTSDIFVYNGHSYIGYGPLDPTNFYPTDFPSSYQVLMINGCVSYNYYEKDYLPLKEGGTKNLDLVTNGLESWVNESGPAMGRFVGSFIDGKINTYEQILKNSQFTYYGYDWGMDALRVVDGELDNVYTPAKTPITLQ